MSAQLVSPTEVAAARLLLELAKDGDTEVDDAVMAIASATPVSETTDQPATASTGHSLAATATGFPSQSWLGSPTRNLRGEGAGLPGLATEPLHRRLDRHNLKVRIGGEAAETASNWASVEVKVHSFSSSREIGDALRSDVAVLLDTSEAEARDAARVVDFAAGVAYALHGSVERLSGALLLLLPPDLAEQGNTIRVEDDDFDEFPRPGRPSAADWSARPRSTS